nr:hypothetical protein [Mycolicibacterium vanbaalenii]
MRGQVVLFGEHVVDDVARREGAALEQRQILGAVGDDARIPARVRPSTTPRLAREPMLVWQNMSLTVVTPDSSISIARSAVPSAASSRVSTMPSGATIASAHSNRDSSEPMPVASDSDRWVWVEIRPGITRPVPSPCTGRCACAATSAA